MKRLMLASAAAAIAFSFVGVASASASNGAATHFTAAYYGLPSTAYYACSGNRIVSNGAGVKDVETCTISGGVAGFAAGTYKSDPSLPAPTSGVCKGGALGYVPFLGVLVGSTVKQTFCFLSDYDNAAATKWTMTFSDNGTSPDTWTVDYVAYYN